MATTHVLITRFSVRLEPDAPPPDTEWLRERLSIFRRYTLPSVVGQTRPPNTWLILFGPSPQWLRDEFAVLQSDASWIRPVETDEPFSPALVRGLVKAALPSSTKRLITTRVDNDDVIADGYLEAVRAEAADDYHGFVNFTHGLQLAQGKLYRRSDPSNAFVSLAEPMDELRTVFVDQHPDLARHGPMKQVHTSPMWIQVVHGGNLANVARGIRADPAKFGSTFTAELDLRRTSAIGLRADQALSAVKLGTRVIRKPSRILWALKVLRPGSKPAVS